MLKECDLIIWDECTMLHKGAYEALDKTLKDLRQCNKVMGGVNVVIAGDFRQTLPVVPKGTRADKLQTCLKTSPIWRNIKRLQLTTNMRARIFGDATAADFSHKLQQLGEGKVAPGQDGKIDMTVIANIVRSPQDLTERVFPNVAQQHMDKDWLCERAILAPRNNDVDSLNDALLRKIPGQKRTYHSVDKMVDREQQVLYTTPQSSSTLSDHQKCLLMCSN